MYFDVAMPLTLFLVILAAMFLNEKVEKKLKTAVENREFSTRDAVLLVATMSITISLVVFIPQFAMMFIFLFAYSILLFVFTLIFSNFQKSKARLFCIAFLVISLLAAMVNLFNLVGNDISLYGALAFFCMAGFTLISFAYEERRAGTSERWYLAVLPPALFILLYTFFGRTQIWFPYLLATYGIAFAILIILYLGSLFSWKTTLIFVGLLTIMDTILVLYTGTMVSAAVQARELRLPVLVPIPTIPAVIEEGKMLYMYLGLGDFFFAGLLGIQTMKKFGKNFAIASLIAMVASFSIFEILMLNWSLTALPGTVMILCGWLPLVLLKIVLTKMKGKVLLTEQSA